MSRTMLGKMGKRKLKSWIFIGMLGLALLGGAPMLWASEPIVIQTLAIQSHAEVGEDFDTVCPTLPCAQLFQSQVLIEILITDPLTGAPVKNLGVPPGTFSGDELISSLPTGWKFYDLPGPASASAGRLSPIDFFENPGIPGLYRIRAVLARTDGTGFPWFQGEKAYGVEVNVTVGATEYRGSALGVVIIEP